MRKVELLDVERAALIDLVHREIAETAIDQREASKALAASLRDKSLAGDGIDASEWHYWTERLRMLRRLKAKLEREEERS